MTPKSKLHALIDECMDELLVDQAIALFTGEPEEWWEKLPESEKQKTFLAIQELDAGKGLSHSMVMQEAWKSIGK